MFFGSMVALVTPMHSTGEIDYASLTNLVEMHIANNTSAIVVNGTTGEAATLSFTEQMENLRFVIKQVAQRIPVIAGIAANAVTSVIDKAHAIKQAGAAGCLILTPSYIKPTQEGLFLYYSAIAKEVSLPIILYNVPSRTACDLHATTVARLAKIPHIVAIKEATGDTLRAMEILQLCQEQIVLLSGDDSVTLPLMMLGAKGGISVTANIAPKLVADMLQAVIDHDFTLARTINNRLLPLHKLLFVETNPIPVKWCLQQLGKIDIGIRLPLTPLSMQHHGVLRQALVQAELL